MEPSPLLSFFVSPRRDFFWNCFASAPAWSFKCHFDAYVWSWDPDWLPALTPLPPPKDQVYECTMFRP